MPLKVKACKKQRKNIRVTRAMIFVTPPPAAGSFAVLCGSPTVPGRIGAANKVNPSGTAA